MRKEYYVVIVDDERGDELAEDLRFFLREHQELSHLYVKSFSELEPARDFICKNTNRIWVVVFDSAFDKDRIAGCNLFRELVAEYPDLKERALFFTAYYEDVAKELIDPGSIEPNRIIEKTIGATHFLYKSIGKLPPLKDRRI